MENTLENKAKFFALYLDQEVYCIEGWNRGVMICDAHKLVKEEFYYLNKSFLILKPLYSISDEDAIEVAKIVCPEMFINFKTGHHVDRIEIDAATVEHPRSPRTVDINYVGSVDNYHEELGFMYNPYMAHAIDYLRSHGYSLPWMGLSVEEQVNRGWVKLKGETK